MTIYSNLLTENFSNTALQTTARPRAAAERAVPEARIIIAAPLLAGDDEPNAAGPPKPFARALPPRPLDLRGAAPPDDPPQACARTDSIEAREEKRVAVPDPCWNCRVLLPAGIALDDEQPCAAVCANVFMIYIYSIIYWSRGVG